MSGNLKREAAKKAYIIMVFDGLCVSSASVILSLLRQQYDLSYDLSGTLLALLSVGNLLSGLLCAALPQFLGTKTTVLSLSAGLAAGYVLLVLSGNPVILLLAFLLIGLGKGSTMNSGTVVAGQAATDRTKCVNIINALFAVGSLAAPVLYLASNQMQFWKAPLCALAVSGLMVWLLFAGMGLSSDRKEAKRDNDTGFLRERHFWYTVCFMFFQQCTEISVTGWLVTYFKDQGILTGALSELTVTVIWLAMLVGRLAIAFVLPQNSRLRSLFVMSIASLVTYVLLLVSNSGGIALLCLFLFGVSESGCYPTGIAQANRSMNNATMGVLLPAAGIGAIVMPYVVGAVAERWGIFAGMVCPGITIVGMVLFAVLLGRQKTD
ncbi:MAG: MFS transporter [Lachnospiraceae bacterium]|nr:MFS transporter [Lachnospiraceae bacterium]